MKKLLTGVVLLGLGVWPVIVLQSQRAQMPVSALASEAARSRGPVNASVRIVEYSNFHCPSCAEGHPMLEAIFKRYPGKIRHEFRHFPEWASDSSVAAHRAAECAAQQGRFWAYHDRLFRDRVGWLSSSEPEIFVRWARELGLDGVRFRRDLNDPHIMEVLMADSKEGSSRGIRSTPTFWIEGRIFVGPEQFKTAARLWIEELLGK